MRLSQKLLTIIVVLLPRITAAYSGHEIYSEALPSLVLIQADRKFGSGVLLDDQGDLVTNYHVIMGATTISIFTKQAGWCHGKPEGRCYDTDDILIKATDPVLDLAILRIKTFSGFMPGSHAVKRPHNLSQQPLINTGDKIYALSYPLITKLQSESITPGIISGDANAKVMFPNRFSDDSQNDHKLLRFTASIDHGSSGGLLLNSSGELVAIVTGSFGNDFSNFAVPIQYVNRMLQQSKAPTAFSASHVKTIVQDKYYSDSLYASQIEDKNTFRVFGQIIDADSEAPLASTKLLISDGDTPTTQRYSALIVTDGSGFYDTELPKLVDPRWRLQIVDDTYKQNKIDPLWNSEKPINPIRVRVKNQYRNLDAVIYAYPSMIALQRQRGVVNFRADLYQGDKPIFDKEIQWKARSDSPWLLVEPNAGFQFSGAPNTSIDLVYDKQSVARTSERSKITFSGSLENTLLATEKHVTVYPDSLPANQRLRISGYVYLENGSLPNRNIQIGASINNNPIDFQAYAIQGRFEAYLDPSKYREKNIKLEIVSNSYSAEKDDPNLIVNQQNEWFTKIKLNRKAR